MTNNEKPATSEPVQLIDASAIDAQHNVRQMGQEPDYQERIQELEASIRANGILQPLVVSTWNRPCHNGRPYRLVFGHRRLVAALAVGRTKLPCIVREMSEAQAREAQLVENLQREDLGAIDEAAAFQAYLASTKASQSELAKKIGKSQPYVANRLRLLQLRPEVQEHIRRGELSPSHGEVLLKIPKEASGLQGELAKDAVHHKLDVRTMQANLLWKVEEWERRKADEARFAAYLKKAKHPNCPKCKKPAVDESYYTDNGLRCEAGHSWSAVTGKAASLPDHSAPVRRERQDPRDIKEGPDLRAPHDLYAILRGLVASIAPKDVRAIRYGNEYGVGPLEITLSVENPGPVPQARWEAVPYPYSTGERTQVHVQGEFTSDRRRKVKRAYEAWARKHLPKARVSKGTPPEVDAKTLEGSIDDVVRRLPSGKKNLERLELLRDLEAKGKARNGVFEAIDLRIDSATEARYL